MHILDKIVAHKKTEVAALKTKTPVASLEGSLLFEKETNSLAASLANSNTGIIAEFKRRSPSKPSINLEAKVRPIVTHYTQAGVSGISVLTDSHFFGGSTQDIIDARRIVNTPLLRKEFIIDEYQIIEAKAIGADAILLITEILTKEEVKSFTELAKSLGLDVLLEIHTEEQLEKYIPSIDIVGVNNRDLTQFTVDPEHSARLFDKLPEDAVKISESGITDPTIIFRLRKVGYEGFLIGERFMNTLDPGQACLRFMNSLTIEG
jgi:indole-3-glycerol phosphate synthase